MTALGLKLVFLSAACTAVANLMLRRGTLAVAFAGSTSRWVLTLLRQPLFLFGVLLYGIAALIWFRVLSIEKLTTSYPMLVSLTFLMVTVGAMLVFREQVSWQKVSGLLVILAGIVLVSRA